METAEKIDWSTDHSKKHSFCRFCLEEEETSIHILLECEAFYQKRDYHLDWSIAAPDQIFVVPPRAIIGYIKAIRLWKQLWVKLEVH